MPPLFGLIANHLSIGLMGIYLVILLVLMVIAYENLLRKK
jgi:fucose permease